MTFLTVLLSPLNLLFFIVAAGFAVGRIRIRGVSVGAAGVLFVAMLTGALMGILIPEAYSEILAAAENTLQILSKVGTSLFVSAVGLQAGRSSGNGSRKSAIAFAIGALMTISGILTMLLLSLLDKSIRHASLLGILCGALTNTPGLSCVCELLGSESGYAVWGYGCAYLPGVLLAVFFAQLCSEKPRNDPAESLPAEPAKARCGSELFLVSGIALLGNLLGTKKILSSAPVFGTTACTLVAGWIVGTVLSRKTKRIPVSSQNLNLLRNLGLALFFVGTGFSAGAQTVAFDLRAVLYGMLITLTAILCGALLCRMLRKKHHLHREFIIAGGMTSSPAYGALADNATDSAVAAFSFSYLGALITSTLLLPLIV